MAYASERGAYQYERCNYLLMRRYARLKTVRNSTSALLTLICLVALLPFGAAAQEPQAQSAAPAESTVALAKKAQNPIANMISLPIQTNTNFNFGPNHATQEIINVQPVIPLKLSEDWNLITRTIVPLIDQPQVEPNSFGHTFGIGDVNPSFFFSRTEGDLVWGVGPTFLLPTATDTVLGHGKWGVGPTGVVIYTPGKWVLGALINNIWSVADAGNNRPDVNQGLLQPIINYNLDDGWYLTSSPIITANWQATGGNQWTVPIGGGVGKLFHVGHNAINVYLQAFDNVVRPDGASDFSIRFQLQFLFPK